MTHEYLVEMFYDYRTSECVNGENIYDYFLMIWFRKKVIVNK